MTKFDRWVDRGIQRIFTLVVIGLPLITVCARGVAMPLVLHKFTTQTWNVVTPVDGEPLDGTSKLFRATLDFLGEPGTPHGEQLFQQGVILFPDSVEEAMMGGQEHSLSQEWTQESTSEIIVLPQLGREFELHLDLDTDYASAAKRSLAAVLRSLKLLSRVHTWCSPSHLSKIESR